MKTWTMPRIDVEAFAANEHVAACTVSGGSITISCDWHGETDNTPTHQSSTANCGTSFTIPLSAWEAAMGNANNGTMAWIDTNGRVWPGRDIPGKGMVSENDGDYALGLWKTDKRYVYNIGKKNHSWSLFGGDEYYYEYVGSASSNHFVLGTANPDS